MSGVQLGSAYGKIEIGTDQAEQNIQSLADTMSKAGKAMSLGVTAPLVGIAATAINSAADFEQSLNVMAQVSGATADQMATLQAQALEMGAVTSFSAGEAAQAQLELAKAGLSVNDIIAATPGVLDMAAAGGMGLAESAEVAANAMNAFNLPASEMPNIANMLAAAANASSVDISDLAMSMKMSGAVFASNKQPMDDMVTALAMLGNAGLKGSDAGTSLKTMLLSLASPTDKANKAMNAIGLSVYDTSGNMRSFSDILSDLSGITAKMTDAERNNALSVIFGSDAIRAATILARDYGESWDGISDALGDGGAAANVAGARMKGMNGAMEYLMGSIDSFLIGAALPYLDMMGDFVRMTADGLTAIGSLPRPLLDAAIAFGAVLAAAGPLMLAITGITAAIGFLLSPLGLVIVAVGAVVAGFVLWSQNVGGIQERVAQLAGNFNDFAVAATGIDFGGIVDGLRAFGSYIGAVLEDGDYMNDWLTHLPESLQPAAEAFGRFVAAVGDLWQTGNLGAFVQELRDMFPDAAAAVDSAVSTITGALDRLSPIFQGMYDVLIAGEEPLGDWSLWWEEMSKVVGEDAATIIAGLTEVAMGVAGVVAALLVGDMTSVGEKLSGLRASLVSFGQDVAAIDWGSIVTGIKDNLVAALGAIPWADALATAGGWLDGFKDGVVAAVTSIPWADALAAAGAFLDGLKNGIIAAIQGINWGGALTTAGAWLDGLKNGVVAAVTSIPWGDALTAAGDFLTALKSGVTTALQGIDWAGALATAATWLDNLKSNAIAAIQKIDWVGALTATGNVFAGLESAAVGALNGLGFTGAAEALTGIKTAVQGLPDAIGGVRNAFNGLMLQITPIVAMVAAFFAPAIERLQSAFNALPEKLAPLMPKLQELGGAFMGLAQAMAPFAALIGVGLAIAVDFGVNRLTTVLNTLPGIVGPIIDQVTATIKLITVILTETVTAVKGIIDGDWSTVWESAKTIAGEFNTFFRGLFSRLGTFMAAVATNITQPIIDTLKDMGIDITPLLEGVRKTFEDIWTKVTGYIQPVIDLIATITTKIGEFKDFLGGLDLPNPFAGLASAGQAVMDAIGGIGNAASGGGADGDPSTPQASGTSYFRGGAAQINERGYEQIVLPAGARIYTNGQSNNLPASEGKTFNINLGGVTVRSETDARRVVDMLRDQLVMAGA